MGSFAVVIAFLLFAVVAVQAQQAGASTPAGDNKPLSDEVSTEFPSWMRVSAEYRARLEGVTAAGFKPNSEDAYLLSRLRINLFLLPSSWFKFGFQAQDAHVFWKNQSPAAPPYQDAMDLRQAYFELGDVEKKSIGFRGGRQELAFGDERLIGNSNWTNTARSFDALRGTVRYGKIRADLFAARVMKQQDGEFDWSTPGNNVYGIYGGIEKLVPNATVEPYFFWRRQSLKTELGTSGILNFGTVGVRWVGKLPANFDYGTEMVRQDGSLGSDSIGAWAGHWALGRTFPKTKLKPRVVGEYNHASGDHNPN